MNRFTTTTLHCTLTILFLLTVATGCGRKADPRPPEAFVPAPVRFLSAMGTVDAVTVSWFAPEKDASGEPIESLNGFRVEKAAVDAGEVQDFENVAEIPLDSETIDPGRTYSYHDTAVRPGRTYEYAIIPISAEGDAGMVGNRIRVTFVGQSSVVELR